ncbi:hypothetical protein T492DRAFT_903466 [Pavlovales sp. CCMP2436]|nr:hypothetical protein T492DRAFT_903466 [Pavlovales sp. CCMP2436]
MVGHVEPDFGERMLPPARQRSTERAAGREDYFDAEDWASAQGSFHEAAAPAVAPAAAPPRSPTIADSPSAASPPPPPKLRFPERSPELVPSSIVVDEYSVGGVFEPASDSASSRCCAELVLLGLYLRACYRWSAYESHAMLIHWSCPHSFAQQPQPQQLRAWVIRLNPGYWAMFMCTVPFLVVGMVFHDMIGQVLSYSYYYFLL